MTLKELKSIYWIKKELNEIKWKLEELEAMHIGASKINDMPKNHNSISDDKLINYIEKKTKYEKKLYKKSNEYLELIYEAEAFIENIADERARLITRMRYLNFKKWKDINKEIYGWCDESTARKYIERYFKNDNSKR